MNVVDALSQIISSGLGVLQSVSNFINAFLMSIGIPQVISIAGFTVNIYGLASLVAVIAILSAFMKFFSDYSKYIFYIALFAILLMIISRVVGA